MSNEDEIELYVRLLAAHVRQMPLREAVPFLKGALTLAGEHPAVEDLRGTCRDMASADDQLELIAGQLKLNLGGDGVGSNSPNGKDGQ